MSSCLYFMEAVPIKSSITLSITYIHIFMLLTNIHRFIWLDFYLVSYFIFKLIFKKQVHLHNYTIFCIGELSLNVSITNYTAIYGTPITLICHVTPNPDYETVHVYWITLTNGVLAFLNAGHHGTEGMTIKQPSLTITRPTFDDIGEYSCNAKDIKGTVTGPAIQLNVIGGEYYEC